MQTVHTHGREGQSPAYPSPPRGSLRRGRYYPKHSDTRFINCLKQLIREFCESLPADRLLQGNECTLADALSNDRPQRTYTEQSTGAKLTYGSSLTVLAHFTACLVSRNFLHSIEDLRGAAP